MILDKILDMYSDQEFLLADGFDSAIIGLDHEALRLIYSENKCIEILMQNMDESDAVEYFEFNVVGAYVGEQTPIWCRDRF
jgi:hypothetical protein